MANRDVLVMMLCSLSGKSSDHLIKYLLDVPSKFTLSRSESTCLRNSNFLSLLGRTMVKIHSNIHFFIVILTLYLQKI